MGSGNQFLIHILYIIFYISLSCYISVSELELLHEGLTNNKKKEPLFTEKVWNGFFFFY